MDKPTMHMLDVQDKNGETRKLTQYLAAVAAAIGAVIAGTILAWTSPALPQLQPGVNCTANGTTGNDTMGNGTILPIARISVANTTGLNDTNATVLLNTLCLPADFILDTKDSGIASSILAIGAAIAALPVGMLATKIGRRPTILILSVPFMLNWLLTIFANGAGMLIAARCRRPTILILSIPFMLNWLLTIFANGAGMLIAARFFAGLGTG
ncbi:sugar transporter domain-containing protein [Phthorimaea operculella]|nr:sugar transporter domain-containing protein [Phthorimaea operculella]